jgi:hypothetical protein
MSLLGALAIAALAGLLAALLVEPVRKRLAARAAEA